MAAYPARQPDRQGQGGHQGAEVEGRRGRAGRARRKPKVARRPDAQRLERRQLVTQVSEPARDGRVAERPEVREVDDTAELRGRQRHEHAERQCDTRENRRAHLERTLSSYQRDRRVDRRRAEEPEEAREAIGVDRARRDHRQRQGAANGGRAGQEEGEGNQEQGLHRLLERALRQVGRGEIGKRHQRRGDHPGRRPQVAQRLNGDQRGEHGDGERDARERLDQARPQPLAEPGGERVRPHRVATFDQPRRLSHPRVQPVRDQQVGGHVVVDKPDAEDPDAPVDDERDRDDQEGQRSCREGDRRVDPTRHSPSPREADE